ncbi:hypothetical protein OH492_02545 [Vibrio chagasii]|nr:hypothetical protein [Vibrio chagasii]
MIPPPPEEKWDYVETLAAKSKSKPKGEIPRSSYHAMWRLQTSAQAEARKLDIAWAYLE